MVASPATAPAMAPVTLGLPDRHHAMRSHVHIATAAAVLVFTNATAATPLAASALPPLKPNQPNHSIPVPRRTNGMLCGNGDSSGGSFRLPTMNTEARAAIPALR